MLMQIKVAKVDVLVDFDTETMPESSKEYCLRYGLTQSINDTHASVARKNFNTDGEFRDAVWAKANKRIDQLQSGNVPGSRVADPNAAAARAVAKAAAAHGMTMEQTLAAVELYAKKLAKAA